MSIRQFDSTDPFAIPADAPAVAGYVDGIYAWPPGGFDRFGTPLKVRIAVNPNTNDGHVGDVESRDMTPATALSWARMRLQTTSWPAVGLYVNQANWGATAQAASGLPIRWWVATLDGTQQVSPPPGVDPALAVQYAGADRSGGNFDLSTVDPAFYGGWFMGVLGPDDIAAIKALLDAGTGAGQADWAHTEQAILSTAQATFNAVGGADAHVQAVKAELDLVEQQITTAQPVNLSGLKASLDALSRHLGVGIP